MPKEALLIIDMLKDFVLIIIAVRIRSGCQFLRLKHCVPD